MKIKLPTYIEELKEGPHKRDMIRHYKKELRKNARNKRENNQELYIR